MAFNEVMTQAFPREPKANRAGKPSNNLVERPSKIPTFKAGGIFRDGAKPEGSARA